MSVPTSTVTYFRDQWATRFTDTCTVDRVTGSSFNDTTGQTENTTTEIYSGACLARPATAREEDFGEGRRQKVDYDLYLPYDAAVLEEGDLVTVTAALDSELGAMTVIRGYADSYLTRRHYECEALADD